MIYILEMKKDGLFLKEKHGNDGYIYEFDIIWGFVRENFLIWMHSFLRHWKIVAKGQQLLKYRVGESESQTKHTKTNHKERKKQNRFYEDSYNIFTSYLKQCTQHFIPNIRNSRQTPMATVWSEVSWVLLLFLPHPSGIHRRMPVFPESRHRRDVLQVHREPHPFQHPLQYYHLLRGMRLVAEEL